MDLHLKNLAKFIKCQFFFLIQNVKKKILECNELTLYKFKRVIKKEKVIK